MPHLSTAALTMMHGARARALSVACAVALTGLCPVASTAQQPTQKTFASPEEASEALFVAVKSNDLPALLDLFGPSGQDIIASGDSAEDVHGRAQFARKYQE